MNHWRGSNIATATVCVANQYGTDVLLVCYQHVTNMSPLCYQCVLPMCYRCVTDVLPMCYRCVIDGFLQTIRVDSASFVLFTASTHAFECLVMLVVPRHTTSEAAKATRASTSSWRLCQRAKPTNSCSRGAQTTSCPIHCSGFPRARPPS